MCYPAQRIHTVVGRLQMLKHAAASRASAAAKSWQQPAGLDVWKRRCLAAVGFCIMLPIPERRPKPKQKTLSSAEIVACLDNPDLEQQRRRRSRTTAVAGTSYPVNVTFTEPVGTPLSKSKQQTGKTQNSPQSPLDSPTANYTPASWIQY